MKCSLKEQTIVIPLFLPLDYPSDYVMQTARILSRNNHVIFLNLYKPEILSWRNLYQKKWTNLFKLIQKVRKNKPGITYFTPISPLPLQRINLINAFNHNSSVSIYQLRFILSFLNIKAIIWGFNPRMNLVVKHLGKNAIYLYDCVDHLGEDQFTKDLAQYEKELFSKVDLLVFNSKPLFEKKISDFHFTAPALIAPCGCDILLFNRKARKVPPKLKNNTRPVVLLSGIFNFRIDVDLLQSIIKNCQTLLFLFIGPIERNVDKHFFELLKVDNVLYLGPLVKRKLPDYYHSSTIGIIPYKTSYNFARYSNPMKAYEYLASGLPVVSTKILALDEYSKDIVYTANSPEEFSSAIRRFIKNWDNKARLKALKIARINSWENKVKAIENFIVKKGYEKN